jgi:hypothetical protein
VVWCNSLYNLFKSQNHPDLCHNFLQDFDLNEQFGSVQVGPKVDGVIEIQARMNGPASIHEFVLRVS